MVLSVFSMIEIIFSTMFKKLFYTLDVKIIGDTIPLNEDPKKPKIPRRKFNEKLREAQVKNGVVRLDRNYHLQLVCECLNQLGMQKRSGIVLFIMRKTGKQKEKTIDRCLQFLKENGFVSRIFHKQSQIPLWDCL